MMTKMMCWPGRLPSPAAPSRAPLPPLIPFFRYSTLPWALFYTPLQKLSDYIMNSKVVKKKYTTVAIDPVNWRGPRIQHQTLTWTWTRAWSWSWTWTWTSITWTKSDLQIFSVVKSIFSQGNGISKIIERELLLKPSDLLLDDDHGQALIFSLPIDLIILHHSHDHNGWFSALI